MRRTSTRLTLFTAAALASLCGCTSTTQIASTPALTPVRPASPALADAAADAVSRDVLGVANASDVAIDVWLATEGSPLDSATPRWFVDGPWTLPPGSLWLHGQQAHEQTVSTAESASRALPPALRTGHGRAFVCVAYADEPDAPRSWVEITRGGLGVKRTPLGTDLTLILMPRALDEPLELVSPLPSYPGASATSAAATLPTAPHQHAQVHQTIADLSMPLRKPAIVLNPRVPVEPASSVVPARHTTAAE